MNKTKLISIFTSISLLLSIFLLSQIIQVNAVTYQTPTLVQGPAFTSGTLSSGTLTVTLASTPTEGNTLILWYGGLAAGGNNPTCTGVTQTGVTWSVASNVTANGNAAILYGLVGAGASTTINVTVAGGTSPRPGEIVYVCEFSGIATSPLDKTATTNGTDQNTGTGTTASTTQTEELWVANTIAINVYDGVGRTTQSTPTNGFTLLNGTDYNLNTADDSLGCLYKVVSTTGTASTGTTLAYAFSNYWTGIIVTLKAAEETATGYGHGVDGVSSGDIGYVDGIATADISNVDGI